MNKSRKLIWLVSFVSILIMVVLALRIVKSDQMLNSNKVNIFIPVATDAEEGVHYEGGEEESLRWGPNAFSVKGNEVRINDGVKGREIIVNKAGDFIRYEEYEYGQSPKANSSKNPELTSDQLKVKNKLQTEDSSELYFWGESSEGIQYWQVNKVDEISASGATKIVTHVYALNNEAELLATANIPTDHTQYVQVYDAGVSVDVEGDTVYFMKTTEQGVYIESVEWQVEN